MFENQEGYYCISIGLGYGQHYDLKEHRLNSLISNNLRDVLNNDVHHKNFCKIDNRLENLELMSHSEHKSLHNKCRIISEETRRKMSENHANFTSDKNPFYNKHHTEESKQKIRDAKVNPCIRIRKTKCPRCKQGYLWRAHPYVDGKVKPISSTNLDTCKQKVEEFINSERNTLKYTHYKVIN